MPKTINITWTQPTTGSPNDYALEYGVSGQALTNVTTGSASTSYQIDDLIDNEIYQLRIAGINSEGTGAYTPVVYHYASQYPSAPLALASGEPANSGDLLLTWNAPEFSETVITNYAISSTPDGGTTSLKNTTNTSYDLTNLDCTKNVNVTVTATNTNGDGPQIVADFVPYCGGGAPPAGGMASILFDATANIPSVAHNVNQRGDANDRITVESWVYIDSSSPAGLGYIIEKLNGNFGYRLDFYYNGTTADIRFRIGTGISATSITTAPADEITHDTWHHVAATMDDDTKDQKLYVNGVEVASASANYNKNVSDPITIGAQSAGDAGLICNYALLRVTKGIRYTSEFVPSATVSDYGSGNDPLFSDVALLITNGTDGSTAIIDESNDANVITNNGNTEYDTSNIPSPI